MWVDGKWGGGWEEGRRKPIKESGGTGGWFNEAQEAKAFRHEDRRSARTLPSNTPRRCPSRAPEKDGGGSSAPGTRRGSGPALPRAGPETLGRCTASEVRPSPAQSFFPIPTATPLMCTRIEHRSFWAEGKVANLFYKGPNILKSKYLGLGGGGTWSVSQLLNSAITAQVRELRLTVVETRSRSQSRQAEGQGSEHGRLSPRPAPLPAHHTLTSTPLSCP